MVNQFRLDGKRALVTGGSKGKAKGFAKAGAEVVLVARSEQELHEAAAALAEADMVTKTARFDFSNVEAIADLHKGLVREHGPMDILVNDAGTPELAPAEDMPLDMFDRAIKRSMVAAFPLCQAFVRDRLATGAKGRIINTARSQASPC